MYKEKYLKYKIKYLGLKKIQRGGVILPDGFDVLIEFIDLHQDLLSSADQILLKKIRYHGFTESPLTNNEKNSISTIKYDTPEIPENTLTNLKRMGLIILAAASASVASVASAAVASAPAASAPAAPAPVAPAPVASVAIAPPAPGPNDIIYCHDPTNKACAPQEKLSEILIGTIKYIIIPLLERYSHDEIIKAFFIMYDFFPEHIHSEIRAVIRRTTAHECMSGMHCKPHQ